MRQPDEGAIGKAEKPKANGNGASIRRAGREAPMWTQGPQNKVGNDAAPAPDLAAHGIRYGADPTG